ncbi:hypothetical protein AMJ80_07060 [bacterium SM23_31]|nr:MAG: hypothetical protein AMJ80_07060 [bacterium SM23_31]
MYRLIFCSGFILIVLLVAAISISEAQNTEYSSDSTIVYNSNYTRLLFSPSGRPLPKGEGFISDFYIFLPSITYAFTDNISLMGGFFVWFIPEHIGKLKYAAVMFGHQLIETFAVSAGVLYLDFPDVKAGISYSVISIGSARRQLSLGIGLRYSKTEDHDFRFSKHPIIMVGANINITQNHALILENWFINSDNFKFSEQPYALAHRTIKGRQTFDLGMIIVPSIIAETGIPRPWVNIMPWINWIYNFGGK